jgi:hypothetical protein
MTSNKPRSGTARILPFERRGIAALRGRTPFAAPPPARRSPVPDVETYAYRSSDTEDDRHRMINNAVASIILVTLIACGVWLADTIVKMRDRQDCALSGRTNCAPIELTERGPVIQK